MNAPTHKSLYGKVAIVTGASSGIGRATALLYARHGAKVIAGARRTTELETLVAEIESADGQAVHLCGDVKDESFARALVDEAMGRFGRLDVAFNNAGTLGEMAPIEEITAAGWRDALDTNLTSAFFAAKYQARAMLERRGGSLIFTSTVVGHRVGLPGMAAYAASKAGLIGLVQVLAAELGPRGIRANALVPGGTDTPMGRVVASTEEARAAVASLHALKRLATPEEIAHSALYLASDASSFTTGAVLLVDGGMSINRS
jgi:NAD(P)-dependent dehydrogenase (short-subunit alcohol dehydrogenase family)